MMGSLPEENTTMSAIMKKNMSELRKYAKGLESRARNQRDKAASATETLITTGVGVATAAGLGFVSYQQGGEAGWLIGGKAPIELVVGGIGLFGAMSGMAGKATPHALEIARAGLYSYGNTFGKSSAQAREQLAAGG